MIASTTSFWLSLLSIFIGLISCEISQSASTTSVNEGESVTLICQATLLEGLDYKWIHNGQILKNASRIYYIGPNLHIKKIVKFDKGEYTCEATSRNSGARQISPTTFLNVIWLTSATVRRQQSNKNALILKCHVDGSGVDAIEWFHNTEKLNFANDKILHIKNPTTDANGFYRCSARNEAGIVFSESNVLINVNDKNGQRQLSDLRCSYQQAQDNQNLLYKQVDETVEILKTVRHDGNKGVYLCRGKRGDKKQEFIEATNENLKEAPESLRQAYDKVEANENSEVVLNCDKNLKRTSAPLIIKWKKDGKLLRQADFNAEEMSPTEGNAEDKSGREDTRIQVNRKNGALQFTMAISSDNGSYECETFNEHDVRQSLKKIDLKIIEQLKFVPQPTSKNLELGIVGKVHCKVQGTPTPRITWIKESDDKLLPDSVEDINGTLTFKNVTVENRGNYTCIATSSQGQINATVVIGTVVSPKFSIAPEGPLQGTEMGSVMIHCQAFGDPKPTIQWDKDLHYITNSTPRFNLLENGTLQIVELHLEDEGRYGCTIGSSAGLKREEARLNVKPVDDFANADESGTGDGFMITRAVLITMSVAFAYIILVVGLMLWCRYRRQARKARLQLTDKDGTVENGNNLKLAEIEPCLADDKKDATTKTNGNANHEKKASSGGDGGSAAQKSDDTAASTHSKSSKKSSNFDQITISRNSLVDLVKIGRGDFGDVFVGKIKSCDLKNVKEESDQLLGNGICTVDNEKQKSKTSLNEIQEENQPDEYRSVMVKALNKVKDENVCVEFRRQIEMFRAISNGGVSKLFGLCRDKDPHYLVLEYTDLGDLKQFLTSNAAKDLTAHQILQFGQQIAKAMDAIYRARYIHKDLATRNCLITSKFCIKVSYPALLKDTYSREYHKYRNAILPIRWMAPECLNDDDYSTKSDVFAFGVVVWELFTRAAAIPFEEIENDDFVTQSKDNKLNWKLAADTTPELTNILTSCWSNNPKERPSFNQLQSAFNKCLQQKIPALPQ